MSADKTELPHDDEISRAATAVAGYALCGGLNEWITAKGINPAVFRQQIEAYTEVAAVAVSDQDASLGSVLASMFTTAFQMGYTVAEGRSLDPGKQPLIRELKKISRSSDTDADKLRQIARLALLREGET